MRNFLLAIWVLFPAMACTHAKKSSFDEATRQTAQLLRSKGFSVEETPVRTGIVGWAPAREGVRLVVEDRSRIVPRGVPYAGQAATPPEPEAVAPRLSLYLFPLKPLSASESMVSRVQAGVVEGALESSVVFTLAAPQSLDQDDGSLREAVLGALFGAAGSAEVPAVALALGASRAELRNGVIAAVGQSAQPPALAPAQIPQGAQALLWTIRSGAEATHTLVPLVR